MTSLRSAYDEIIAEYYILGIADFLAAMAVLNQNKPYVKTLRIKCSVFEVYIVAINREAAPLIHEFGKTLDEAKSYVKAKQEARDATV
jgi:hypothetical protein